MVQHAFLRALACQKNEQTPIWLMRQAGRYLPEYRALRKQAGSFLAMCKNPELACEVTLQPIERFPLDAAIIFSDILTVPDALGLGLYFVEGEGPKFEHPINTAADVDNLPPFDMAQLRYVTDAIDTTKKALNNKVPLIGFSGSPWTLAVYMLEGGSSRDFRRIKRFMYQQPQALHALLGRLADAVVEYLCEQINSGANAVQIFDTWGGILEMQQYHTFSQAYMKRIVHAVNKRMPEIPIIVFTKGGGNWAQLISETGANAIGLDWQADVAKVHTVIPSTTAIQGNLDPAALYAPYEMLVQKAHTVLDACHNRAGFVFNLGHGVMQETDPEKVALLIDTVHAYRT